jgi:hypothetical protein
MTQTLKHTAPPTPLECFRAVSARAEWLSLNNAWTKTEFSNLVAQVLEVGDSDDLEPLLMAAPAEYAQQWFAGKIHLGTPLA